MLSPSGGAAFPATNSPQRVLNDAKGRSKVALKPGRSLMDWIRYGRSGKDLQGFCGKYHTVTKEELSMHNQETDCWMAIRGKVYNITPYLEYHPGGIPEILRGAGQDGTDLFDEVHKWVNVESMLSACLIGPLSTSPKVTRSHNKSTDPASHKKTDNTQNMPPPNGLAVSGNKHNHPRTDWFQNESSIFLSVYTKRAHVTVHDVIVDCENKDKMDVKIFLGENYFLLRKGLEHSIETVTVKAPAKSSGKIEIVLGKTKVGTKWEKLGSSLDGDDQLHEEKSRELKYRTCIIKSKEKVTHDTYKFGIELPDKVCYSPPIGHHCIFRENIEGMDVDRSYTAIDPSLFLANATDVIEEKNVLFYMIKIYKDGVFTPQLEAKQEGDKVMMSDFIGDFDVSRLEDIKTVFLVAAGTGLTPMIRVITYCLFRNKDVRVKLLFANKTERDILWESSLNELQEKNKPRFIVDYMLSQPDSSWNGLKGRVRKNVLSDILADTSNSEYENENFLCCICGPTEFTASVKQMMLELNVREKSIHCFLG